MSWLECPETAAAVLVESAVACTICTSECPLIVINSVITAISHLTQRGRPRR